MSEKKIASVILNERIAEVAKELDRKKVEHYIATNHTNFSDIKTRTLLMSSNELSTRLEYYIVCIDCNEVTKDE